MTYFEQGFTHGGAGAYRQILSQLLSNGWSIVEGAAAAAGPATAMDALQIVQSSSLDIRSDTQNALSVDMSLPICWFRPTRVYREIVSSGAKTEIFEGTDFTINYQEGTFQAIGAGWASDDTERLLIESGDYDVRRAWLVLSSSGLSTQENNLFIGMRLDSVGSFGSNFAVGIRWCLFHSFTATVTNFFSTDETVRNKEDLDLKTFVHPTASGTVYGSVNADRFVGSVSIPEAHNAWAYCGALGRIRPVLEQDCVSYMAGSRSDLIGSLDEDKGPVGDLLEPGNTADSETKGAVWRFDLSTPQFSSDSAGVNDADLNIHHMSRRAEGGVSDIVPSEVQDYFELHPVAAGRDVDNLNLNPDSSYGHIYGIVEGLFSLIQNGAQHRTRLNYLSEDYTVLKVGRSLTRFIAIKQA